MGIYNTQNLEIEALNEVYFGQTPGITKVFDAFCKFRDKYVTNRKFFSFDIDADHDPDLADFIKEVEREFNIYSFSFLFPISLVFFKYFIIMSFPSEFIEYTLQLFKSYIAAFLYPFTK